MVRTYENNTNAILINKLVSFDGVNTLDNILKQTPIVSDFDLLSIDIDGNDYHVWESLVDFQPKVVVIEFNPAIPSDVEFIQEKKFSLNQGNSLLSLIGLGKQKGYELVATTLCNGFFVRREFFDLFQIGDNGITSMWDSETPAPRVFQLFDGTLVLSERFKLIWHDKYVNEFDLQILPPFLRFFGDSASIKGIYKKALRKLYYKLLGAKNRRH